MRTFARSEYNTWKNMISRCHNVDDKSYVNYGARGITVCREWRESFKQFYADMGARPLGLTLERTNNNEGYAPTNCKWASRREQTLNRRMFKNNTSGYKGVYFDKTRNKWRLQTAANYKKQHLGYFSTLAEAVQAKDLLCQR